MIFEGGYKNGQKNGKGKEYDYYGTLRFEGEYLNGQKNGKGKEYYFDGKLGFEGEFLNGQKNRKGKEYYFDGNLKFEGNYKINRRWAGKGYDPFNNLIYELKDGKGLIKEYDKDGIKIFEGEYLNGQKNGKGKEYNQDGELIYEGEFLNDQY